MTATAPRPRLFSLAWVIVLLIAAAGIVLAWLAYPTPIICPAIIPAPANCFGDPRLMPAVLGTIIIVALSATATLLRRRWPWARVFGILIVAAAILAPVAVLFAAGFVVAF